MSRIPSVHIYNNNVHPSLAGRDPVAVGQQIEMERLLRQAGFDMAPAGPTGVPLGRIGGPQRRRFSFINAALHTVKGGLKSLVGIVKGIIDHPIRSALMIGAGILLASNPIGLALLIGTGVTFGGFQIMRGLSNSVNAYQSGDVVAAERAFEDVGAGATTVGLSLMGARGMRNTRGGTVIRTENGTLTASQSVAGGVRSTARHAWADLRGRSVFPEGHAHAGRNIYQAAGQYLRGRVEGLTSRVNGSATIGNLSRAGQARQVLAQKRAALRAAEQAGKSPRSIAAYKGQVTRAEAALAKEVAAVKANAAQRMQALGDRATATGEAIRGFSIRDTAYSARNWTGRNILNGRLPLLTADVNAVSYERSPNYFGDYAYRMPG